METASHGGNQVPAAAESPAPVLTDAPAAPAPAAPAAAAPAAADAKYVAGTLDSHDGSGWCWEKLMLSQNKKRGIS